MCYLLLNGELSSAAEAADFELGVMRHTMLHEQLRTFYNGFRRDAHPMAVMCGVVGALSAFYHDSLDVHNPESRRISAFRLIAKVPTIAAWAHKYAVGQPFIYPHNDLTYAENFLHMFHAVPAEDYKINPVLSKAMDLILILHADHEQNASTSTVRLYLLNPPLSGYRIDIARKNPNARQKKKETASKANIPYDFGTSIKRSKASGLLNYNRCCCYDTHISRVS